MKDIMRNREEEKGQRGRSVEQEMELVIEQEEGEEREGMKNKKRRGSERAKSR